MPSPFVWLLAAAPACDAGIEAWVARCGSFDIVTCHRGVLVVRAPEAKLDVEIRARSERSFRSAGELGLSPVGQFADWSKESDARRKALDALVACAERDRDLPLAQTPMGGPAPALRAPRPPWLLLGAAALFVATLRRSRELMLAALLGLVTFLARWALVGGSYFHQNGQGPGWVAYALRDDAGRVAYGPGYPELFGAASLLSGSDPERGLWLVQSLLAALAPPAAWLVARRAGAGLPVAAALAVAIAIDPLAARLAGSESYFAASFSLGMLAIAALGLTSPHVRSKGFWLPVAAAGLLLAQMVRVHPSAWPAALLAPMALLVGPGSFRRRVRLFALGLVALLIVVALTSGPALAEVLSGSLGQKWLPNVRLRWELLAQRPMPWLFAAALVLGALVRSWRGIVVALGLAAVLALARLSDLTSDPNPAVTAAHQLAFLPLALALASAAFARIRRPRAIAMALLVASLGLCLSRWHHFELPTDAREARFVRELRAGLPAGVHVAYLARAGSQLSELPLHSAKVAPLGEDDGAFALSSLPAPAYWFRSSLCSTGRGAPVCAELEKSAKLEPVAERVLPARPSMRWEAYASPEVRVVLFRISP